MRKELYSHAEIFFWMVPGILVASFLWVGLYVLDETLKRHSWRTFIGGLIVVVGTAIVSGLLALVIIEMFFPSLSDLGRACAVSAVAGIFGSAGKDGFLLIQQNLFRQAERIAHKAEGE